jgi:hypothetical protein
MRKKLFYAKKVTKLPDLTVFNLTRSNGDIHSASIPAAAGFRINKQLFFSQLRIQRLIFIDKNLERSRGETHVARLLLLASVPINQCQ